ncbi:MAG TPA: hypothetical protein VD970_07085 [Acetobacteraceae bacterium]|nr:hypothetical protein [Acetobacteraceae bacterium]
MRILRYPWLDWPISRLVVHAEANREDVALLQAIQSEIRRRATPQGEEALLRIQGLLEAQGIFEEEAEASPELAARLEDMAQELRALRDQLARAERRVRAAEARAAQAERQAEQRPTVAPTIHDRVHLAPTAPGWLVEAAQRAFRMRYHPDRFADAASKSRAEAVFKEAEAVFTRLRGDPPAKRQT